jgi:ABC-2 type transport system permease protein
MPIFDQGYQHWSGKLSSHVVRWLAVTRHGVRATVRGRLVKLMLIMAWLPAVALVVFLALWGLLEQRAESVLGFLSKMLPAEMIAQPQQFRSAVWTIGYSYFFKAELTAAIILVLIVGPNLVSRDLRFNAFPLYFSRPLRRFDYFLGKLGVIGFFLMAIAILPAVVAYILGLAFSLDIGVVRDTHRLLWGGILYGLIIVISAGTLMLAMSSLSRRSIYVALAWGGFCFLTFTLSGILITVRYETERRRSVDDRMGTWLAEHPPPPGMQMAGIYPIRRYTGPIPESKKSPEEKARDEWFKDWSDAMNRSSDQVVSNQLEALKSDWRPLVAYTTNLNRVGDWLLDSDRAWVTIGSAIEKPRRAFGPAMHMQPGVRMPRDLTGPRNDRFLADFMVLQFPVSWSIAVLTGLWVVSALVLMTRVKSLDRLK